MLSLELGNEKLKIKKEKTIEKKDQEYGTILWIAKKLRKKS